MEFERYQRMIQKLAHMASDRFSVEYEDMEAQGYLIYCECVRSFDITKAGFSTYLYINLSGRLKDYGTSIIRQRGIFLHDMLDESLDDRNSLLAIEDNYTTLDNLLDFAKKMLSDDAYLLFKWIVSFKWERKGRKTPSLSSAIESFDWGKTKIKRCWNECRAFWQNEGAVFCC